MKQSEHQEKSMIELPWPPTVNTYYRSIVIKGSVRVLISAKGRAYRKAVFAECIRQKIPGYGSQRLRVVIVAHPPDKRRRDIDNICKGIFDSLEQVGVYDDDSQIDDLRIVRREVSKPGRVEIMIEAIK